MGLLHEIGFLGHILCDGSQIFSLGIISVDIILCLRIKHKTSVFTSSRFIPGQSYIGVIRISPESESLDEGRLVASYENSVEDSLVGSMRILACDAIIVETVQSLFVNPCDLLAGSGGSGISGDGGILSLI